MSLLASFIAALERTGGERLVLRSGEPPHLLVGEARRDLGTASVSNKALTALTAQILSAEAQRTFAETNAADEPLTLTGAVSAPSLFVEARRSGSDTSITLRRILPQPAAADVKPAPAAASMEPVPPSVSLPPAPAEPDEWEPVDLAAPSLKVESVVESRSAPATDEPVAISFHEPLPEPVAVPLAAAPMGIVALAEPPPEPTAAVAETLPAFIAELTRTDSDRLVFRSGEPPHLLVGETRHDLDTATVTNKAMEEIASLILSADAQRAFADTNGAVEPLSDAVSSSPLVVEARRTGNEICIELLRRLTPESDAPVLMPVKPASTPVSGPSQPAEPVATRAEPTKHVSEPNEPSESDPIGFLTAQLTIVEVPDPEPSPAAAEPMGVVALPEPPPEVTAVPLAAGPMEVAAIPVPEPAAVPVAAGPWRIVTTPPQEPKAVIADAVPTNIAAANRVDTKALEYWIRLAARRDATAMYLRAGQAVVVRVRERVEPLNLDGVDRAFIEGVTAAFAANGDKWRSASDGEWVREYDGVGEVRCQTFTDQVGPGLVVLLSAQHSASTLQRYIPRQVRRSCEEDDGIVLVSAESAADVLAMVAAVAQWTAQRRAGYVISMEPPHGLGHDLTGTFVSARRIDGTPEDAAAIRRAAQERPDILVIALPSGIAAEEAIRGAKPGCLIILGVVAPTAPRALESLLSLVNPRAEPQMRRSLAAGLRCGFSYRALRRIGGGRTIVHDALVATREVRAGLNQGDFGALDKIQRSGAGGMRSLDTALARAVHRREISLHQAAINAVDCGEVISLVRQASRERARTTRDRPGVLRAVAGASSTQPI